MATDRKYIVIKNFTADKKYYIGNTFSSENTKLIKQLLTAKLIK